MQDAGYKMHDAGCMMHDPGYMIQETGEGKHEILLSKSYHETNSND